MLLPSCPDLLYSQIESRSTRLSIAGIWMLALNATHKDDRRLCASSCLAGDLIAMYDYPKCAGFCDATAALLALSKMQHCLWHPANAADVMAPT